MKLKNKINISKINLCIILKSRSFSNDSSIFIIGLITNFKNKIEKNFFIKIHLQE